MVRELIGVVVARLRIDLPAICKQVARTVKDDREKQATNLFSRPENCSRQSGLLAWNRPDEATFRWARAEQVTDTPPALPGATARSLCGLSTAASSRYCFETSYRISSESVALLLSACCTDVEQQHDPRTPRPFPCRFAADLVHDTREGFTDIHRQYTGSNCLNALRDALLKRFGRTALDLAFVIMIDGAAGSDVDDARMTFVLVPEFCVRARLYVPLSEAPG